MKKMLFVYKEHKLFLLIFLVALALRIIHINWGLPELYEEATPFNISQKFWDYDGKGANFNPHFFNYPALTFYLHYGVQAIHYGLGKTFGSYHTITEFLDSRELNIILARAVTVIFDLGCILVVYLIGLHLRNRIMGLFSALVLALNPLHIIQAHFIQVDTPLTFFCILSMYLILKTYEKSTLRKYIWLGISIGAAIASKYTGAFLLFALVVSEFILYRSQLKTKKHWNNKPLFYGLIATVCTFMLFNPYLLLNFNEFQADFLFERQHVTTGHLGISGSETTIGYYLMDVFGKYLGWALLCLILAGIYFIVTKKNKKGLIILSFPLIYLLILSSWQMRAERYILPIFPLLILLGGIGISEIGESLVEYFKRTGNRILESKGYRTALATMFSIIILIQPLLASIRYLQSIGLDDTRTLTKQWIQQSLGRGGSIASGPYGVDFPSEQYTTIHIPFLAFESERVAPFYDTRWYENVDLLITSDYDYGRYAKEPERYKEFLPYYDTLKSKWKLLFKVQPGEDKAGPAFWIYRCPDSLRQREFTQDMFDRFLTNPESARISNFLKELNVVLLKKREIRKSAQIMENIVSVETGNLPLRNQLSTLLIEEGKYEEALKHLQYSIRLNNQQPKVFALAGKCLFKLNKLKEAEATLITALNSDRTLVDAYEDLAELFTLTHDNEKLKILLNNYLGILPDNSQKALNVKEMLSKIEGKK